jgi:hypothetical protein
MVKRRQTYTPLPPSNFAIGWLIACCAYTGILIDVAIFKVLGAW